MASNPRYGFWRVLYRFGRNIGRFTVHGMVKYALSWSSTFGVFVSSDLLRDGQGAPWQMA